MVRPNKESCAYKTKDLIGPLQNESNKQEPLLVEVMTKLLFSSERQRMGENTGGKNIFLLIQNRSRHCTK